MISEINELAIGIDLGPESSQLTFYNRQNSGPRTVSVVPGGDNYQIETPKNLFSLVEDNPKQGIPLLADFFHQCLGLLATAGKPDNIVVAVTMKKVTGRFAEAVKKAFSMNGVPEGNVYLQDYRESFYWFILNQRKELWTYQVALFTCEKGKVTAYELSVDRRTRPILVSIEERGMLYLDEKARNGMDEYAWNVNRDQKFLELAQKMIGKRSFSSVYLVGDEFEKCWLTESLMFLCNRRKVFMGENLYTTGACYGAMEYAHMTKLGDYLYAGPDMIDQNIGMEMLIRGHKEFYPMVSAGVNWYMASHTCEFILDGMEELVLYSRSMSGEQLSHTVKLEDLPKRPNRATRLHMEIRFISKWKCRVTLTDMGLGGLYPATGKTWEAVIVFERKE